MEYLPLVIEGIENKVKKLVYNNQQLKEENNLLSKENINLQQDIEQLKEKISLLEGKINTLKVTRVLSGEDNMQARLKINELLREIGKCYSLLNR